MRMGRNRVQGVRTLKLTAGLLRINPVSIEARIKRFIRNYVQKSKASGVVLAVSGGVDSCTAAALATESLGGENVLGIVLSKEGTLDSTDIQHAKLVADRFAFKLEVVDISSALKACSRALPIWDASDEISNENVQVRIRMVFIYYYANRLERIVCGSLDKSETMMGYFAKWGDVASDISPLMDVYKTQVRQLASYLNVPPEIISKPSTPRLRPDQLAEEELGLKYEMLDLVLYGLERFMTPAEIAGQLGLPLELVDRLRRRWLAAEHKRRLPLSAKLGFRTVGADFRLPFIAP